MVLQVVEKCQQVTIYKLAIFVGEPEQTKNIFRKNTSRSTILVIIAAPKYTHDEVNTASAGQSTQSDISTAISGLSYILTTYTQR